jgi:hypothetical protein
MHEKWIENYYKMRDHVLASLCYPLRVVVGLLIYRKTTQTLYGQGTLRFTPKEIASMRLEVLEELSARLLAAKSEILGDDKGSRPFWLLGGDRPSEADAVCYGFVVSALICTA